MLTLYRQELSGPQQQAQEQQQGGPLPMQRPTPAPAGGVITPPKPTNARPDMPEEFSSDIDERANMSMRNRMRDIQNNRFTSKMQERVQSMATNIRGMIESGQMTEEEGKQVLADSVGSEFKDVTGWMNGRKAPQNYMETKDPVATKKFLEENKQAFEKMRDLKSEIVSREEKLRKVFNKEDPRFMKASQDIQTMKQKYSQMFEGIRMKMTAGAGYQGNQAMRAQRGQEVL